MRRFFLATMLIVLAGCGSQVPSEPPRLTFTPSPSLTLQSVATQVMSKTATLSPVPSFTPVVSRPISTPAQKENSEITLELIRTNNGCELPCWWGIVPNQTQWNDAEKFLSSFSQITLSESQIWSVYFTRSPLPVEFSDVYALRAIFSVQEGLVKEIEIGYFNEETYHLSSFLLKYGAPSQILISTYSSDSGMPPNTVPFTMALYYPEMGIMATYATDAKVSGSQITGCFLRSPTLFLWSPSEHNRSIDYIMGWDKNNIPYMNIEDATDIDIQGFYEDFSDPTISSCLQTSTSLWQSQ